VKVRSNEAPAWRYFMQIYQFAGEHIKDICEWCRSRGEKMVKYKAYREVINPLSCEIEVETDEGEMPESFWNSLTWSNGWNYQKVEE
jgi:hypothetical protein